MVSMARMVRGLGIGLGLGRLAMVAGPMGGVPIAAAAFKSPLQGMAKVVGGMQPNVALGKRNIGPGLLHRDFEAATVFP